MITDLDWPMSGSVSLPCEDGSTVAFSFGERQLPEPVPQDACAALAAMLRSVASAPELAARLLLARFESLGGVLAATRIRLLTVPGLTPAAADLIQAAHATATLALRERVVREPINSWTALETWLRLRLGSLPRECSYGLFLDVKGGLIRDELLAEGTSQHYLLTPRTVVAQVMAYDASAVILVHNHPSGDCTPSPADITFTRDLATVLTGIDVALHDHVIVGCNSMLSMRRERLF